MRVADVLATIDQIMNDEDRRFDLLAQKAGLDPKTDFIGMDLRQADFSGAVLRDFNFALCDLRGTNLHEASSRPRNVDYAITDHTTQNLSRPQLRRYKQLIDDYLGGRTAARRLVTFVEFLNSARDIQFIEYAARTLAMGTRTRMEDRVLQFAQKAVRALHKGQRELGPVDIDKFVELLSKMLVGNGYPYQRARVALELSTLLPVSKGAEVYLKGLSRRSYSRAPEMREVKRRVAHHLETRESSR